MSAYPIRLLRLAVVAVFPGLAGCVAGPELSARVPATLPAPASLRVGVLVPLSGPNAALGRDLRQAVELALGPDGPQADVRDTGGTAAGAAAAAQAAVAAGDVMIVGPLTQGETAAVAGVAAGTPVLAFTSDRQQARPGVWPLGITPQQQMARLVPALAAAGRTKIAAVLPDNVFGQALVDGLNRAAADAGQPAPMIRRYPNGKVLALDAALRDLVGAAAQSGAVQGGVGQVGAAQGGVADPLEAAAPPFEALLLGESGATLRTVGAKLASYGVQRPAVQVVGPLTWVREPATTAGLSGAWFAAPDPAARTTFEQAYARTYGAAPPAFADIAYDAGRLARLTAGTPALLSRAEGFDGVDGKLVLRPDGQVARGLAVFVIEPGGAHIVDAAPAS